LVVPTTYCATKFFVEFRTPFFKKSYLSLNTDYTCEFALYYSSLLLLAAQGCDHVQA
jgi:hypothetical protein